MADTIAFSEKAKGWCHFDYLPDAMCRLNNRFFMIKDGQLHLANDKDNPVRNNFFGVQYESKIKTVFNPNPSDDKIFKTLVLESSKPWAATVRTNLANSTIAKTEFVEKQSRQFAYLRQSENDSDNHGLAVQGIGAIVSSSGTNIVFEAVSEMVSRGDRLYQLNAGNSEFIGTITNIALDTITVDAITTAPVDGRFAYSKKNARIEGPDIRGYFMEVELVNDDTEAVELFSISTNAIKSRL